MTKTGAIMLRLFAENMDALLERDPLLAEKVRLHPLGYGSPTQPPQHDWSVEDSTTWANAQLPHFTPDRIIVVFGLGNQAQALRALTDVRCWFIEPSLQHFVNWLDRHSVLPFLMNGRLFIAEPDAAILQQIRRQQQLLRVTTAAIAGREDSFLRLEGLLGDAQKQALRLQEQRSRDHLLSLAGATSPLGQVLAQLPPLEPPSLDAVDQLVGAHRLAWTRPVRTLLTMKSFQ